MTSYSQYIRNIHDHMTINMLKLQSLLTWCRATTWNSKPLPWSCWRQHQTTRELVRRCGWDSNLHHRERDTWQSCSQVLKFKVQSDPSEAWDFWYFLILKPINLNQVQWKCVLQKLSNGQKKNIFGTVADSLTIPRFKLFIWRTRLQPPQLLCCHLLNELESNPGLQGLSHQSYVQQVSCYIIICCFFAMCCSFCSCLANYFLLYSCCCVAKALRAPFWPVVSHWHFVQRNSDHLRPWPRPAELQSRDASGCHTLWVLVQDKGVELLPKYA